MSKRTSLAVTFSRLLTPDAGDDFELPPVMYYIARACYGLRRPMTHLSKLETWQLGRRHQQFAIDRPIYITGLARGGTTITLEMLSRHPDVATHHYSQMPNPFLPIWWDQFFHHLPVVEGAPIERIHRDGIMVTRDSPEALEEPLWQLHFDGLHDEARSQVLDGDTENPEFERFYRDHLWKLMASQGRTRYLAKSNYSVTRMEYLLRLFPDARFLIIIRNPIAHVASYLKQNRLFEELASKRMRTIIELIGHLEFGHNRTFINCGDRDEVRAIRATWTEGNQVAACARYWSSIYGFVAARLEADPALAARAMVVRYEDLVGTPTDTIDAIIDHTGLDAGQFAAVEAEYADKLRPPSYYEQGFSTAERTTIVEHTAATAAHFGYRPASDRGGFVAERAS